MKSRRQKKREIFSPIQDADVTQKSVKKRSSDRVALGISASMTFMPLITAANKLAPMISKQMPRYSNRRYLGGRPLNPRDALNHTKVVQGSL
jgi:hypothetical protein